MGKIVGIVLVAGLSRRMGVFKPLLPYKDKSIITHLIEEVSRSNIDEIVVITGHNKDLIAKELENLDLKLIFNENYKAGMHSSVMCGAENLPDETDAFIIILGDQPQIETSTINNVIKAWQNSTKGIVIPSYSKRRGHPVIFDKKYINQAKELDPHKGLKLLIEKNNDDIEYLIVNDNKVLLDIDTPEDYSKMTSKN